MLHMYYIHIKNDTQNYANYIQMGFKAENNKSLFAALQTS